MKRLRTIALAAIYVIVFLFTMVMENMSISNPQMRLLVNGSTLLMVTVGGILFWIIYRSGRQETEKEDPKNEEKFDKAEYQQFATEKGLTKRETEIGLLIMHNYSNLQIAEELFIAESTVKKHVGHIYEKTDSLGRKDFKKKVRQTQ